MMRQLLGLGLLVFLMTQCNFGRYIQDESAMANAQQILRDSMIALVPTKSVVLKTGVNFTIEQTGTGFYTKRTYLLPSLLPTSIETFKDADCTMRHGNSKVWYDNGFLYSQGLYANDKQQGPWTYYHADGSISSEVEYDLGEAAGIWKSYYLKGKLANEHGYNKNSKLDGSYLAYFEDGSIMERATYDNGKKTASSCISEASADDCTEALPAFPVAEDAIGDSTLSNTALFKFLSSNLKYPAVCRENGYEAKVLVRFRVNTEGQITDVNTRNAMHEEFRKEALRVFAAMPTWEPGHFGGKPTSSFMVIPVSFRLQ